MEQEKFVVEGGGAVCVAAIMAGLVDDLIGKKYVIKILYMGKSNIKKSFL